MNHLPFENWLLNDMPVTLEQQRELELHVRKCSYCSALAETGRMLKSTKMVSPAAGFTARFQARLLELDVRIEANQGLQAIAAGLVTTACVFTGRTRDFEASSVILVTDRDAGDQLFQSAQEKIKNMARIGDCFSPGTIAAAVHAGRQFAEEFGTPPVDFLDLPYLREVIELS